MDTLTLARFRGICRKIATECPDPYAKSYASRGQRLVEEDEIKMQVLYIQSNLNHWRGEEARITKLSLEQFRVDLDRATTDSTPSSKYVASPYSYDRD